MRVFLAGSTGQIGRRLVAELIKRGDQVVVLSRNVESARKKLGSECEYVQGDPMTPGPWQEKVSGCEGVINLAGENLFNRRWKESFKTLMRESRTQSTSNVVEAIAKAHSSHSPPSEGGDKGGVKVLVNGSAIGYYGFHGDEALAEGSPPGDDFLAKLCVDWEQAARPVEDLGVRLALVRTGVVLDREGGALKQMWGPFKWCVGGKAGSGKQWLSWVHFADEVGIILLALDHPQARGPINATAPNPVTNKQFAKALGAALHRPSLFPTPAFMLRLMLGEVADLVTKGQRVLPEQARKLGYKFQFPDIGPALADLATRPALATASSQA